MRRGEEGKRAEKRPARVAPALACGPRPAPTPPLPLLSLVRPPEERISLRALHSQPPHSKRAALAPRGQAEVLSRRPKTKTKNQKRTRDRESRPFLTEPEPFLWAASIRAAPGRGRTARVGAVSGVRANIFLTDKFGCERGLGPTSHSAIKRGRVPLSPFHTPRALAPRTHTPLCQCQLPHPHTHIRGREAATRTRRCSLPVSFSSSPAETPLHLPLSPALSSFLPPRLTHPLRPERTPPHPPWRPAKRKT